MIKKKAQANVMETSFMIIALVLFFVIVGIFVITIAFSGIKDSAQNSAKTNAMYLVSRLAESPEFNCPEGLCVDSDKILALTMNAHYKKYWMDVDGIEVIRIYPNDSRRIECNIDNYPNCNTYVIVPASNNSMPQSSFVSLCRVEYENGDNYQKCELGKIKVYTKL